MNYKMIRFVISWVLKVEGMLMLLPALVGAMYQVSKGTGCFYIRDPHD